MCALVNGHYADDDPCLLGGVGPQHLEQAWRAGAQGVAGIRALWPQQAD